MQFLSYLTLVVVLYIYLKLVIDYHPKWLNLFKESKEEEYSNWDVSLHMLINKIERNEKLEFSKYEYQKSFLAKSTLCWFPISDYEVEKNKLDKELLKKIFFYIENEKIYSFNYFGNCDLEIAYATKEQKWNETVPKQSIGYGVSAESEISLKVFCNEEFYKKIRETNENNQYVDIEIKCSIKTEKEKLWLYVKEIKSEKIKFGIEHTYQYTWWNSKEINGEKRKELEKKFPKFLSNLHGAIEIDNATK
jgi:hypothetical protein